MQQNHNPRQHASIPLNTISFHIRNGRMTSSSKDYHRKAGVSTLRANGDVTITTAAAAVPHRNYSTTTRSMPVSPHHNHHNNHNNHPPSSSSSSMENHHRSAPDLSRQSFWLSPLSPANIKTSPCKLFSYPTADDDSTAAAANS